jgi:uncharacterized membrane protein
MSTRRIDWLVFLVVSAAALLWLWPLSSSLWLDELDTYFTTKDGVQTAMARTSYIHPQCSQLYNALMAQWIRLVGSTETLLRLPSTLAMTVAAYLVFRLGRLLFDRETGLLAALVFVTSRDVAFAAADARSYAFATAASVAATIALLRLLAPLSLWPPGGESDDRPRQRGERRWALAYAAAAALTVYFHQIFALLLVAHGVVALVVLIRGDTRLRFVTLVGTGALMLLLLAVELPNLFATAAGRERIVHGVAPYPMALVSLWANPLFVVAVVPVAVALHARGARGSVKLPEAPGVAWLLLLTCAVLPPLALFVISRLTDVHVFLPRYYLSCQAAMAIVLGALLRAFEPRRARLLAAASVAAVALAMYARPHHAEEDWRGMIAAVNAATDDRTVIAIDSGFIEGADPDWLALPADDERYLYLLAPLSYYPLHGRIRLLPYRLDERTRGYVEGELVPAFAAEDRFVVISRGRGPRWWELWLDGRLGPAGYEAERIYESAYLGAAAYDRRLAIPQAPMASPRTNGTTK